MKTKYLSAMLLAFGSALWWAPALYAQSSTSGSPELGRPQFSETSGSSKFAEIFANASGSAELGGRQFNGSLGSSKFTEYRDLPTGMFTNAFSLNLTNTSHVDFLSLWGSHVGQRDQNFAAQAGVRGKYKLELEWGQIPHNYSNTARTVFNGAGSSELKVPAPLRRELGRILTTDLDTLVRGVQFDTSAITGLVLGTARGLDVVSRREKGKAALSYSPSEELDIQLRYTNEERSGTKPLGGNFAFNPVELVEPTDYRTQEASASVEYAAKAWNAQLGYSASIFDNDVNVLVFDNPFREIDAVGNASRGRLDLYPDNTAQNVNLSGAANLPLSTRLMMTVSRGWRRQDDQFIPYTINAALSDTVAKYLTLPAASLGQPGQNGEVIRSRWVGSLSYRF